MIYTAISIESIHGIICSYIAYISLNIIRQPRPVVLPSNHICSAVESHVGGIMYGRNDALLLVGIFYHHPLLLLSTDLGLTEDVGLE